MILRRLLPRRMVLAMRVRGFEFVQTKNAMGQASPSAGKNKAPQSLYQRIPVLAASAELSRPQFSACLCV